MSVRWVRVGDVLELRRQPVEIDPTRDYEYVGVRSFARGLVTYPPTPGDQLSKMRYFSLPRDALVISNIKAWEGAVATTSSDAEGIVVSNRFLPYKPRTNDADIRYVWHYFASEEGTAALARVSPGSADRNRTLGIAPFENLRIPLPGLPEQRRIAARLDAVAAAASHVHGGANPQAAVIRERLVSATVDGAPGARLGDLMTLKRNPVAIDSDSTYQAIGVRAFGRGLIRYAPARGAALSKLAYYKVPPDSLVVSNIKAWEGAAALTAEADAHRVTSSRFLCYLPRTDEVSAGYVCAFLLSRAGIQKLGAASPGSADRNRTLGRQRFEAITVPVPPPDAQRALLMGLAQLDRYGALRDDRTRLAAALLPAARNEEFSRLTSA